MPQRIVGVLSVDTFDWHKSFQQLSITSKLCEVYPYNSIWIISMALNAVCFCLLTLSYIAVSPVSCLHSFAQTSDTLCKLGQRHSDCILWCSYSNTTVCVHSCTYLCLYVCVCACVCMLRSMLVFLAPLAKLFKAAMLENQLSNIKGPSTFPRICIKKEQASSLITVSAAWCKKAKVPGNSGWFRSAGTIDQCLKQKC